MTTQLDRLDKHTQDLKDGTRTAGDFGAMSTGEKLYIALAASSFELLTEAGYSIPGALDRLGPDWCRELITRWR
jgi:hypothetical protein